MKTNAKIYVMKAHDGTIKLGHSVDPIRRSRQIGKMVSVVHQTDIIEHVEKIERLAHRVLALHGKHLRGEWFEARIEDAILAIDIATRQAENELHLGGRLGKPAEMTSAIPVRIADNIVTALDDLRRLEADIPSRSEMIRRLIDRAHASTKRSKDRKAA